VPLTLRTRVPEAWFAVEVRQGSRVERVTAQGEGTSRTVSYEVVPNAGPARISKAEP
jgi:hypothetical protein